MKDKHHDICAAVIAKLEQAQKFHHVGLREIFLDFCTLSTAAFHNILYSIEQKNVPEHCRALYDKLEKEFKDTLAKYKSPEKVHSIFAEALAILTAEMQKDPFDYLGKIYMDTNMNNKSSSQFFTPSHISEMMAKITIGSKEEFEEKLAERGYIGIEDPCCGAGSLTIGMAKALQEYGTKDITTRVFIRLTDIDQTCVKMAFIAMCMLGLSATVIWGDALAQRADVKYNTPNMQIVLAQGDGYKTGESIPSKSPTPLQSGQLSLF